MNRQTFIRQVAFASGGLLLIPGCMSDKGKASILLKKIRINGEEEKILAELAETIIPETDTPGAKSMGAHLFAMMMVDDCYTAPEQGVFLAGLEAFGAKSEKDFGKSFHRCNAVEKVTMLTELEAAKAGDSDLNTFYGNVKSLVIQSYTSSKFFLTKVQVYRLVPGRYSGCVPAAKAA